MAARLPTLSEPSPISIQPVNSRAESYEAFGKTLGGIADRSMETAKELGEEQSNAGFLQTSAQFDTIKTNAQIEMIKHPDQAMKISTNSQDTLQQLTQSAFVNKKDRQKLDYISSGDNNDLRLKAASLSFQQSKDKISLAYWEQYPITMKSIQDSLVSGDFKKAMSLEEGLHQASYNAAQMGAISPNQFKKVRNEQYQLYTRSKELLGMLSNPDGHTATDFHIANSSPYSNEQFSNTNFPVHENTAWTADHLNNDRTMSGQMAAIYNGEKINWGVVAQSSEHEYQNFLMQWRGKSKVEGAFNSGMPASEINARMEFLEGQAKLSPEEQGEYNYWKSFSNQMLKGDGYLKTMSQTSLGGRYAQDYNQKQIAIENSGAYSPEGKIEAMRDNYNDYIGNMVSLGRGQHIDASFIKPIPYQSVIKTQSAFEKDAPVDEALKELSYLHPENQAYLADAMKKPNQSVSIYLAGATLNKADPGFQAQLIEANQARSYESIIGTGSEKTSPKNLWDDIASNSQVQNILGYLSQLPGGNDVRNGFKEASVNYVLYQGAKHDDTLLHDKTKYQKTFIDNISKGFDIQQGNNYIFNRESLGLRNADMSYLAHYALSEAYKKMHEGRSEVEFQSYLDLNPLHAINTPDGRIVVVDKIGNAAVTRDNNPAFDHPYTSNMLSAAHSGYEEIKNKYHPWQEATKTAKTALVEAFVPEEGI